MRYIMDYVLKRYCSQVAVDNKENVQVLTAEEMATLISDGVKLVAELVQPRKRIIEIKSKEWYSI